MLSERIREPAKRMGGAIRSCRVQWFEERADEAAKLERVARAVEEAWPFMFEDIPKKLNSKRARYERLYEALADLPEDALGG